MSENGKKIELIEVKNVLDSVSPSFCVAKWKQVTFHLHNGRTHSCHHPYTHKVPLEELRENITALHNTMEKKEKRKEMLEGVRPAECAYCWHVEDLNKNADVKYISDRVVKSAEPWAINFLDEIPKAAWDSDVVPSYVEVNFSNQCNLKCSYCSPVYSSQWMSEIKKYGPYPTSMKFGNLEWISNNDEVPLDYKSVNPYVDAFWEWWPSLVDKLHTLRITGGEPLLVEDTFKVISSLSKSRNENLTLAINTNGSVSKERVVRVVEDLDVLIRKNAVAHIEMHFSMDGWGEEAEYSRYGLNFDLWKSNIEYMLTSLPDLKVYVMCTTNIFSIGGIKKLIYYISELRNKYARSDGSSRVVLDAALLRYPHHQNIAILTADLMTYFDDAFKAMCDINQDARYPVLYSSVEMEKMRRIVTYMQNKAKDEEHFNLDVARNDFYKFVNEHDKRRGTDFLNTFPYLQKFYDICRKSRFNPNVA